MNIQSVFDTSVLSYNIGNDIIMDAVYKQLDSLFPSDSIVRLPIEDISTQTRKYNRLSQYSFVGGTNVLNGDLRKYRQWDLNIHNALILKNVVLLGCGWLRYEDFNSTKYTKWVLNRILSKDIIHSVRDNYTLIKCMELGLKDTKFVNTGCPTLWELTPELISRIPLKKSDAVVFTITDYYPNKKRDSALIKTLKELYDKIYFFPQGTSDIKYLTELGVIQDISILTPRLRTLDDILATGVDYVGTRLHAGIRALQHRCRSLIIGIDNRAKEMSRDFSLPVLPEEDIELLRDRLIGESRLQLNIPWKNIVLWKSQFGLCQ